MTTVGGSMSEGRLLHGTKKYKEFRGADALKEFNRKLDRWCPLEHQDHDRVAMMEAWKGSFDALVQDSIGVRVFMAFLSTEYSEDNLRFWLDVLWYKQIEDHQVRNSEAWRIYSLYLDPPEDGLNLEKKAVEEIRSSISKPTISIFDQAQDQIYRLMKTDSYERFICSPIFLENLEAAQKGQAFPHIYEGIFWQELSTLRKTASFKETMNRIKIQEGTAGNTNKGFFKKRLGILRQKGDGAELQRPSSQRFPEEFSMTTHIELGNIIHVISCSPNDEVECVVNVFCHLNKIRGYLFEPLRKSDQSLIRGNIPCNLLASDIIVLQPLVMFRLLDSMFRSSLVKGYCSMSLEAVLDVHMKKFKLNYEDYDFVLIGRFGPNQVDVNLPVHIQDLVDHYDGVFVLFTEKNSKQESMFPTNFL